MPSRGPAAGPEQAAQQRSMYSLAAPQHGACRTLRAATGRGTRDRRRYSPVQAPTALMQLLRGGHGGGKGGAAFSQRDMVQMGPLQVLCWPCTFHSQRTTPASSGKGHQVILKSASGRRIHRYFISTRTCNPPRGAMIACYDWPGSPAEVAGGCTGCTALLRHLRKPGEGCVCVTRRRQLSISQCCSCPQIPCSPSPTASGITAVSYLMGAHTRHARRVSLRRMPISIIRRMEQTVRLAGDDGCFMPDDNTWPPSGEPHGFRDLGVGQPVPVGLQQGHGRRAAAGVRPHGGPRHQPL